LTQPIIARVYKTFINSYFFSQDFGDVHTLKFNDWSGQGLSCFISCDVGPPNIAVSFPISQSSSGSNCALARVFYWSFS